MAKIAAVHLGSAGEMPPRGRAGSVRLTYLYSSRRVPVPIVFGVCSLVNPSRDTTPDPLTSFSMVLSCNVQPGRFIVSLSLSGNFLSSAFSAGV